MTERRRASVDTAAVAPPTGHDAPRGSAAPLVVVTDRPELFADGRSAGRRFVLLPAATPGPAADDSSGFDDPAEPATWANLARRGAGPTVVLDVAAPARLREVLAALASGCPGAAALVLCGEDRPEPPESLVARCVPVSALLAGALASNIEEVERTRRLVELRRFAGELPIVPILVQEDPDPDALACALAVRALLRRDVAGSPIVSLGSLARPENRRMADLLDIQVSTITRAELGACERVVTVDVQPPRLEPGVPRWAVVDHHPPEDGYTADFRDIRPEVGAASTILTEYLRADDERRVGRSLATALLYGIRTDTATLSRGATAADAVAYAFLQERADRGLLRRIERPAHPPATLQALGRALSGFRLEGELALAFAGSLEPEAAHVVADLADLCLTTEGARWSAAGARVGDEVTVALRHVGGEPGAGALARRLAARCGRGGGHASMARWSLPADEVPSGEDVLGWLASRIGAELDGLARSPAHTARGSEDGGVGG